MEEKNKTKDERFTYEQYRVKATENDVEKMKKNLKPYWWENFPVLGAIIYSIRISLKSMDIDRGTLRKQILKWNYIFMICGLFYIYFAFTILTPWCLYLVHYKAIKSTEALIKTKEL